MLTLLDGPNFSGRSDWLLDHTRANKWPAAGLLNNSGESVLTGLSSSVGEELAPRYGSGGHVKTCLELYDSLNLAALWSRPLHVLSGGELVRCAIASAFTQGITDLLVDTSLEQLDTQWRATILKFLKSSVIEGRHRLFLADNRLADSERQVFDDFMIFPKDNGGRGLVANPPPCLDDLPVVIAAGCDIDLDGVSFRYKTSTPLVFQDMTISLKPGGVYVLQGGNGAGKSTFLRLLGGTVIPNRGSIRFGATRFNPQRRTRYLALSFQNPDYQFIHRTTKDELASTLPRPCSDEEHRSLLDRAGVSHDFLDMNPVDLPFVARKRLANAVAFVSSKPIVAFDEPTLGQDAEYRSSFVKGLRHLADCGRTVLLITHDGSLVDDLPLKTILDVRDATVRFA